MTLHMFDPVPLTNIASRLWFSTILNHAPLHFPEDGAGCRSSACSDTRTFFFRKFFFSPMTQWNDERISVA